MARSKSAHTLTIQRSKLMLNPHVAIACKVASKRSMLHCDLRPSTSNMASFSWRCQLCFGSYVYLKDLASHVRATHSSEASLNYVYQVQGCPRIFKRPSTWYKHVIKMLILKNIGEVVFLVTSLKK